MHAGGVTQRDPLEITPTAELSAHETKKDESSIPINPAEADALYASYM